MPPMSVLGAMDLETLQVGDEDFLGIFHMMRYWDAGDGVKIEIWSFVPEDSVRIFPEDWHAGEVLPVFLTIRSPAISSLKRYEQVFSGASFKVEYEGIEIDGQRFSHVLRLGEVK